MKLHNNFAIKIYNDKITFTEYDKRVRRYKYFNEWFKVDLETGELINWTYADFERRDNAFVSSISRTNRTIEEIAEKNIFTHFITITFNRFYVDRYSALEVHKLFKNIVKRFKYVCGSLSYIAVPEYHFDGAIHYHCLFTFYERRPRLTFYGWTKKRHKLFTVTADFKRYDCDIKAELLDGTDNNIEYLTKYITKGMETPLARRFSCSRNLNRSRLVRSVCVDCNKGIALEKFALNRGFKVWTKNSHVFSLRFDLQTERGAAEARGARPARPYLSNVNTKDENNLTTEKIFALILADYERDKHLRQGKPIEYVGNGKNIEVGGKSQLSFVF